MWFFHKTVCFCTKLERLIASIGWVTSMSWFTQSLQHGVIFGSLTLTTIGCSGLGREQVSGIPEIQGVWRYSEGKMPHLEPSLTFEFQRDQFRVSGHPDIYAYGKYAFEMSPQGVYEVALAPEESRGFEARNIQVQPTGGRLLLIDRITYRKILRQ